MDKTQKFDAIVIGYGPVGALGAGLLARRGWRVAVVDRLDDVYPLPRAVRFDGEVMRMFQELGLADTFQGQTASMQGAEFLDAKGERLHGIEFPDEFTDASGWRISSMFHQPLLERTLRQAVEAYDGVTVFKPYEAHVPTQDETAVGVQISPVMGGEDVTLEADYLIAADGAASPIRKALGFKFLSLGYDCDWVVVDVLLKQPLPHLGRYTQQICDPDRIVTCVPGVGNRRRWEFRLNAGEKKEEMVDEATIWRLLAPWVTPETAEIERAAGYQFHAAIADHWRDRRIFLAGDAAHQTPPFLGEGMCAGMRDVANLAWKLDMVRRGLADDASLDTYQMERGPHALDLVDHAVSTGKLMDALTDAHVTGDWPTSYDAAYGGERGYPHLHGGVLALQEEDAPDGVTGFMAPQPRVDIDGSGPVRLDDLADGAFCIVSAKDLSGEVNDAHRTFLTRIGAKMFVLDEASRLSPELDLHLALHDALIVRPDRYIFGVVNAANPLSVQLDKLQSHFLP